MLILGLAALFLAASPPTWVLGAGAGAGAAVAAVAVQRRRGPGPAEPGAGPRRRAALGRSTPCSARPRPPRVGPWLVLVLLACGLIEVASPPSGATGTLGMHLWPVRSPRPRRRRRRRCSRWSWVAFKVGALSYGGGFVIIPLMQHDAVHHYHWMTNAQFLNAVALGQVTPGPVVHTVAVVGYAAAGVGGGCSPPVAFAPSFVFVLFGAPHFDSPRDTTRAPGPSSTEPDPPRSAPSSASAIPLALALQERGSSRVLAAAAVLLLAVRRGVVGTLPRSRGRPRRSPTRRTASVTTV